MQLLGQAYLLSTKATVPSLQVNELPFYTKNANRYASYKLETVFLRGKAATIDGLSTWILNEEDIKNVHEMLTNP